IPGLMQLPILGALFKSRDFVNRQTELMVLVTPYVVHAVAQKELSRPDDGYADASDPAGILLGKFNRIYGPGKPDPRVTYHGNPGCLLDSGRGRRRRATSIIQRAGDGRRSLGAVAVRLLATVGGAAMLAGCYPATPVATPDAFDYRLRHPIAIKEGP